MPREKKIPDKPRFDFVTQTAYKFLLECGYTRFPISPYDVLDELKDYVVCLPWSKAKKVMKSEDPFHLRQQKAEGRTIRMRSTGLYYIIYDDVTVNSPDRISWTIMHEIGHVILGHLIEFSETALNRGGMTSEQYGVLEVEAHYSAAEFLMPTAILKYITGITVDEIALLFGVSDEAAEKKYKRVFETISEFATPKPYELIERIIRIATDNESIVLDSFAGSGTTAHAVLNMNKADGGHRKFILIELMDYADDITAERVKRVINGYGTGKQAVEGTGGNFSYYELGEELMKDGQLNKTISPDKIREYVYFTETKSPPVEKPEEPYYLGTHFGTAYYFCYEREELTTLSRELLHTVKTRADAYVIYADTCILSERELEKYHITFKKNPRDIARL